MKNREFENLNQDEKYTTITGQIVAIDPANMRYETDKKGNSQSRDYDETNPMSIERYAISIEGFTAKEATDNRYELRGGKGGLGQLIEEGFFGYAPNSRQEADFSEAGIELKVAPLKRIKPVASSDMIMKRRGLSAKERIVLTMIDYHEISKESWENASFRKKIKLLLMFYLYNVDVNADEYVFDLVSLWEPSNQDMIVIKSDWEKIQGKVLAGKAEEISEGDTMYLGACTKGASSSDRRTQPNSRGKAPQRAFSLKRAYVDYIYEELLRKRRLVTKQIIESSKQETSVFDSLLNKMKSYEGKSVHHIMNTLHINRQRKAKNFLNLISKDMITLLMGSGFNEIDEFKKSGMEMKTILLKENGVPKESMSFEQIDYCSICYEDWDTSEIKEKFENKKHLWMVFKARADYKRQKDLKLDDMIFQGAFYWNMPIGDLNNDYRCLWEDTIQKIRKGDYNNFMRATQNRVGHIRPKARNSSDLAMTPQNGLAGRKCFWLNAHYIADQISNYSNSC